MEQAQLWPKILREVLFLLFLLEVENREIFLAPLNLLKNSKIVIRKEQILRNANFANAIFARNFKSMPFLCETTGHTRTSSEKSRA